MAEDDFAEFSALLDAVCSLLSRGAYAPSAPNTALFFRALQPHPLAAVRQAFSAHVTDPQRGRFVPVPADIVAQLQALAGTDSRPGPEEAWSIALGAVDEADTVVWTAEIARAWDVARPVYAQGDEVGARMAFREAYGRLVDAARASGTPAQWTPTLGTDRGRQADALRKAADLGRLPQADADALAALPGPRDPVLLLAAPDHAAGAPSQARRDALLRLRQALQATDAGPSADELERQRTAGLKAAVAERVRAYTGAAA